MSKETNYYFNQFVRGRMTRREFIGRMTAAGLSAAAEESGGDLLADETVETLWTPQLLADGSVNEQSYALGWRSDRFDSSELGEAVWRVHHGGVSKGAMSWLAILPELDLVIALNSNSRAETFGDFSRVYLRIAHEFETH